MNTLEELTIAMSLQTAFMLATSLIYIKFWLAAKERQGKLTDKIQGILPSSLVHRAILRVDQTKAISHSSCQLLCELCVAGSGQRHLIGVGLDSWNLAVGRDHFEPWGQSRACHKEQVAMINAPIVFSSIVLIFATDRSRMGPWPRGSHIRSFCSEKIPRVKAIAT